MKKYENVRRVLQAYVDNNEIAGASIIIQEGDEVALKASVGWQDAESRSRSMNIPFSCWRP